MEHVLRSYAGKVARAPKDLSTTITCPEPESSCKWVRVIRFSSGKGWNRARWIDFIERERDLMHNWLRANVDPTIARQNVEIIILQRGAMQSAAQLFTHVPVLDDVLPPSSRPAHLPVLLAANLVCRLFLTSPDGLLVDPYSLQRAFLRWMSYEGDPCLPAFAVRFLSWSRIEASVELPAVVWLRSLSPSPSTADDDRHSGDLSRIQLLMAQARVCRLAASLRSQLNTAGRHKINDGGAARDSLRYAKHDASFYRAVETTMERALGLPAARATLTTGELAELAPAHDESALSIHLRWLRYSSESKIDHAQRREIIAQQSNMHASQLAALDLSQDPRQTLLARGSTMLDLEVARSKAEWKPLFDLIDSNILQSISLASEDGLLSKTADLQGMLINRGGGAQRMPRFTVYVGGGLNQFQRYSGSKLVRAISGVPSAPKYTRFVERLTRARASRLAAKLSRALSSRGRNSQGIEYPPPPIGSFERRRDVHGALYYRCCLCDKKFHRTMVSPHAAQLSHRLTRSYTAPNRCCSLRERTRRRALCLPCRWMPTVICRCKLLTILAQCVAQH